jgi:hypothetical protein
MSATRFLPPAFISVAQACGFRGASAPDSEMSSAPGSEMTAALDSEMTSAPLLGRF